MTASATSAARVRTQVVTAARAHGLSSLTRAGIPAGQHAGDHRLDAREQVRDADQVADDVVAVGPDPRQVTLIGLPDTTIPTARTVHRRLLTVPGRITRTARTVTLRMPARWPSELAFRIALERLRAMPALT